MTANSAKGAGVKERIGGTGKIKYESDASIAKGINWLDPPLYILLAYITIISFTAEYVWSAGSVTLVLSLIFGGLYHIRSRPHDNIPMGDGYIPFFGHSLNAVKHWSRFYDEETEQFLRLNEGKTKDSERILYYSTSIPLGKNFIFLVDPKLVDYIFRIQFSDAGKGTEYRRNMKPVFGVGILSTDGKLWKKYRSIGSRIFTVRSLRDFMYEVFDSTSSALVKKSLEIQEQFGFVDLYNMFNRLTLEAFTHIAFGVSMKTIDSAPAETDFSLAFDRSAQICAFRFFNVWWPILDFLNIGTEKELKKHAGILNDKIGLLVRQRKEQYLRHSRQQTAPATATAPAPTATSTKTNTNASADEISSAGGKDLLTLYFKFAPEATDLELRDLIMNFVVAGRDTTAQLCSWFSYEISKREHAHVDARILEEIHTYVGDVPDHEITYQMVSKLKYMESCFLETLRLHPSVPHLVRFALVDIKLPDGKHVIRKGDGVVVPVYAMGRMPWLWPKPLVFDPMRFENNKYTPALFPAFNIPPRLCLGKHLALLEAKVVMVKILRKYRIVARENQRVTYEFSITNQMKDGFYARLQPRAQQQQQ